MVYLINKIAQEIRYTICLISYLNYGMLQITTYNQELAVAVAKTYTILWAIYTMTKILYYSTHVAPFTILWDTTEGFT